MDDRKLQIFLAVVTHGSFSKASESLHCTQSAVTQAVKRLEHELGCTLLFRHHSGVTLTPAGQALLPDLQAAYQNLEQLLTHAGKLSARQQTHLRIGAFSSIANTWLPKVLRTYRQTHSDMVFEIKICTGNLEERLHAHQIDIAFGDDLRLAHSQFIPLMKDRYFAAVPAQAGTGPDHMTQPALAKQPFLMAPMNALEHVLSPLPANAVLVDCDDDITLLNMVAGGLGATAMPELSLRTVPDGVSILPLVPPVYRTIGIGLPGEPSAEAQKFNRFVQKCRLL